MGTDRPVSGHGSWRGSACVHLVIELFLCPYPLGSVDLVLEYPIDSLFLIAHLTTRSDYFDGLVQTRLPVVAHEAARNCILAVLFVLLVQLYWGSRSQKLLHEYGV